MLTTPRLLMLALLGLLAASARAHDPAESWAEAVVHADRLELRVIMAAANALKLIAPAGTIARLTPENLPEHRGRLLRAGAGLFTITSLKSPLAVRETRLELTPENDLAFTLVYPRPAPGLLILDAAFLKKLGEGFGAVVSAGDAAGRPLGWDRISWEHSSLVVMLPAAGGAPEKK